MDWAPRPAQTAGEWYWKPKTDQPSAEPDWRGPHTSREDALLAAERWLAMKQSETSP